MNSDPAILDYKSMAIPSPKALTSPHQSANTYGNGTNFSGDHYMNSPPDCGKNSSVYGTYPTSQSPRNGSARFPISTFTGMEGNVGYTGEPATNNSSYQDQSGNQGTRETGIIEKLLVSFLSFILVLLYYQDGDSTDNLLIIAVKSLI